MEATTANRMIFLAMEDDDRMGIRLPRKMKEKIVKAADKKKFKSVSQYVKMAVWERLEKDLKEL